MFSSFQLVGYKSAQRCSYQNLSITGSLYLASCHSHLLAKIHLTSKEKTTEEDDSRWVYCPYHLALVDRVDMVDLYSYITSRTRTVEHIDLHILCLLKRTAVLIDANTQVDFSHLAQGCQTSLESILIPFEFLLEVRSQRHVAKCRNKNCLRLGVGSSGHSIRQLVDVSEETCLKQGILYSFSVQNIHILLTEIGSLLLSVGFHLHTEHLSALTSLYGGHSTAHGRGKLHLRTCFVDKQRIARIDMNTFLHNHLRSNAHESIRHESILLCLLHLQRHIH